VAGDDGRLAAHARPTAEERRGREDFVPDKGFEDAFENGEVP